MKKIKTLGTLSLLVSLTSSAVARRASEGEDWPQWRGPERTGVSIESDWNAVGQADPLWTKSLGLGHSSFAVADGRVFTLGYDVEAGVDAVFCFDAVTGKEIWSFRYPSEIWDVAHDGGAVTTPTVIGERVYTSNREGKVFCLESATGVVVWSRDLRAEMELEPPTWGFSASPLLLGDRIVMNVDRVVAIDRHTGAHAWATEKKYGIAYSTPAAFELDGRSYLASLSGDGLAVLDAGDGSEVDFYDWVKEPQIYPMTPVVIGDRIFISGGYDRGCAMLQLKDGELEELWSSRVMRNKMSGCVLWQDHLFGFDESILKCIALDGTERWRQRGMGTGSMCIAGGRLLILDGKGQVIVAEANPEAYVELSRQDVFDDGTFWSTPVLSHGRVYCRSSLGQMACLDYRASAATAATDVQSDAVAAAGSDASPTLPDADALVARHREVSGADQARERVTSVRMSGTGESLRNTVRTGSVELDWVAGRGFSWRDESGFQIAHNSEIGWIVSPGDAPEILKDAALEPVREAGDLARLFDPAASYASLRTLERVVFDNRDCYAVAAKTPGGEDRRLYFECDSGLYAGHDGENILMWTVGDYRDFDGVMLPTRWAFYEPDNGEMNSCLFDAATINPGSNGSR